MFDEVMEHDRLIGWVALRLPRPVGVDARVGGALQIKAERGRITLAIGNGCVMIDY